MKPLSHPEIRIVLADDHAFVRAGVNALLSTIQGVVVLGEARDGEELLQLVASLHPDVVVTDLTMPGLDGLATIARLHAEYPQVRILVLSMHDSPDVIRRAMANGASGYLRKGAPQFELEQAVRSVARHDNYFGSGVAQLLLQNGEPGVDDVLTTRQIEILVMLAEGKSSKEIGFELGLSSKTVDVHRARIMERLQLTEVASLTRYAVRKGLVTP